MIELTRLNGNPLFVNGDLVKWAEAAPDTMLTLVNGEKVVVRESCAEVVDRMVRQRVRLLADVIHFVPDAEAVARVDRAASVPGQLALQAAVDSRRQHPPRSGQQPEPDAEAG